MTYFSFIDKISNKLSGLSLLELEIKTIWHETHVKGLKMAKKIIGIDLGTTNSVVAVMEGGSPK